MGSMIDAFWRAAVYCVHPRVIALSFLPLLLMVGAALGLGYFFWDPLVQWLAGWLDAWPVWASVWQSLEGWGWGAAKDYVAPLVVIVCLAPVVVIVALLVVALLATPALVSLVAQRRFPALERKRGGSWWLSLAWSLGSALLALVALLLSMPLWLIPPLVLVLPPLIWGWLTYRVMAFDALAEHASAEERAELLRRHRVALLVMGVVSGFLGAAPAIVWASGILFVAAFMVLVPLGIWIYTLVFVFSSLWFIHYCLAGLERLRAEQVPPARGAELSPAPQEQPAVPLAAAVPPPLLEAGSDR
ncbi:EI24 domain-containing protein [Comamonas granuli]|uniref:EI24 domain-containing protein n=1 Tax=Comamonas granuli TaxID=290309 RepID=UPI0005A69F05|nr:EI24 domain-containing protein [Comamonas granuli]